MSKIQDIYPLTPTQRGLLFHNLYQPQSGSYVVQLSFTLVGSLNWEAFDHAWQGLAQRHDVLRTAFAWDKLEAPLQVVGKSLTIPCCQQDITEQSSTNQQHTIAEWLKLDRLKGFDLAAAPLMRIQCFHLEENSMRVICSHHHILLDGWSLPLMLRDWQQLYRAASLKKTPQLAPASRFKSYIDWLAQQDKSAALTFWEKELEGFTEPNEVLRRNNSVPEGNSPSNIYQQLSKPLSDKLSKLAQTFHITKSTIIQGAWALLISRYSDSEDVTFGLTRSGRPVELNSAQNCVGLFITTLPMRVTLSPNEPIDQWLRNIQERHLTQQAHEHIALSDLRAVSEVGAQQNIFDSIVVFENYPMDASLGGNQSSDDSNTLQYKDVSVDEKTHYPLSLFAIAGEQWQLRLLFDSQLFQQNQVSTLFDQLHTILESFSNALDKPTQPLHTIRWLSLQQQGLQNTINQSACPAPEWTVVQAITKQAQLTPNAIAVIDQTGETDYKTLEQRSALMATRLQALGFGQNPSNKEQQRIAICIQRNVDMVITLLAILRCGAAYVPLDPEYPVVRLQHMLNDSHSSVVICDSNSAKKLNFWDGQNLNFSDVCPNKEELNHHPVPSKPCAQCHPNQLAYSIYTSGSSGLPKGVNITHRNLSNLLQAMAQRTQFTQQDTWLAVTTLSFDIAALELFLPLITGGKLLIANTDQSRNSDYLKSTLQEHDVTFMQATPATWRLLKHSDWQGKSNLNILSGGEALDCDLAKYLLKKNHTLWNVYGPTETTIWSSALKLSHDLLTGGTAPIGSPLDNTCFYILNKWQQQVPTGMTGELFIGGLGLSTGYIGKPDLSAEKFIPNPIILNHNNLDPSAYQCNSATLYRTGDNVRLRFDGFMDFVARMDSQIKLRGYRIELGEIESQLQKIPSMTQAVAIVQGNLSNDMRLVVFYCLLNGTKEKIDAQDLRTHLATRLPNYMVPSAFFRLDQLPQTPNGKVDRRALESFKEQDSQAVQSQNPEHSGVPETALEASLLELWRELLQNTNIGLDDHFFEAGGHSLLIITIQNRLKHQLDIDIPIVALFQYPTINTLARHIEQQQKAPSTQASELKNITNQQRIQGRQRLVQRRKQHQNKESLKS